MHPLFDPFEAVCERHAERAAVWDQTLALDYVRFRAAACGLARHIAARTERPRVGVMAPTSTAGAAAIFACWYAGRTPVPLNFMLAPQELARVIADADLDLLVTIEKLAPLAEGLGVRALPLSGQTLTPEQGHAPDATEDDIGVVLYTSGTAGDAKGVCLTFGNLVHNARACIAAAELSDSQAFLGLLPLFHAYGFTTTLLVPLLLGAAVHYLPRFNPLAVASLIAEQRISVFITIASMFGVLAAMKDATREQFASLTHPISGGEPLPPRVAQVFEQRFGPRIYEGYGMTEASPVVSLNAPGAYRAGSVGRPLPGIAVVAADEEGRHLPADREGQLLVRGHCVMRGYLNKPAQTAQVIRDGWLWTGDIGRVDQDGFVYITGRAKEMMIVGGENVFPIEIERVLIEHPAVAEAAVIGVVDDVRGEVPVAYVIPAAGAAGVSEADLRSFCRERLAPYKVPRRILLASDLPRGATGKILKRALQQQRA